LLALPRAGRVGCARGEVVDTGARHARK
jgi:hypothetical protein